MPEEVTPVQEPLVEDVPMTTDDAESASTLRQSIRDFRGETRQADEEDEVRDMCSKTHPNRYVSGVTGVTESSNQFDVLGLLSDEDSSPGHLHIDFDV